MSVHDLERGDEPRTCFAIEIGDALTQAFDRLDQIVPFCREPAVLRLDLAQLVLRAQIYAAEALARLAQPFDLGLDGGYIHRLWILAEYGRDPRRIRRPAECIAHIADETRPPFARTFDPCLGSRRFLASAGERVLCCPRSALRVGKCVLGVGETVGRLLAQALGLGNLGKQVLALRVEGDRGVIQARALCACFRRTLFDRLETGRRPFLTLAPRSTFRADRGQPMRSRRALALHALDLGLRGGEGYPMPGENLAAFLEPRLELLQALPARHGRRSLHPARRSPHRGRNREPCASFDERGETRQPVACLTLSLRQRFACQCEGCLRGAVSAARLCFRGLRRTGFFFGLGGRFRQAFRICAGRFDFAIELGKPVARGEAAARRGRGFCGDREAVPTPEVAFAGNQALAGAEPGRKPLAVGAAHDADLGEAAGEDRRRVDMRRQGLRARGQGRIAGDVRARPVHGRGIVRWRIEVVAERRAECGFKAAIDADRVEYRRPQLLLLDVEHLRESTRLGLEPV